MRIQNPLAAAVAAAVSAIVVSLAMQPAEAAPVTIDNFTAANADSTAGNDGSFYLYTFDDTLSGPLNVRQGEGLLSQATTPYTALSGTVSSGSGIGTLSVASSGTAGGSVSGNSTFRYDYQVESQAQPVDLIALASTAGVAPVFQIETGPTCFSSNVSFIAYMSLDDSLGNINVRYDLPAFWAPNQTYIIPFANFPGIDLTQVTAVTIGFDNYAAPIAGTVPFNATAQFTLVAVPEPSQMVFVAGAAAMLGAWRLRKLRRGPPADGEALAC